MLDIVWKWLCCTVGSTLPVFLELLDHNGLSPDLIGIGFIGITLKHGHLNWLDCFFSLFT